MSFHDEDHVLTCVGVIVWDGITEPDPVKDAQGAIVPGKFSHNLRIAIPDDSPEIAELQKLVKQALANSKVQGVSTSSPGNNPISEIDLDKFPELPGHVAFSASTRQGAPAVFNASGKELESMQYGKMMYPGAKVKLLVHAYPYNNKQKGINFGLDGIQVIDGNPTTAPRLSIGSAGLAKSVVAAAFGGGVSTTTTPARQGAADNDKTYNAYADAPELPGDDDLPPELPDEFPPAGWKKHPKSDKHFFKGSEVLTEAALREKFGL